MYMYLLHIFLSMHICNKIECMDPILTSNDEIRKSLGQCMVQAYKRYSPSSFETVTYTLPMTLGRGTPISSTDLYQFVLPILQAEQHIAFLTKTAEEAHTDNFKHLGKSNSYFIQVRGDEELAKTLGSLKNRASWNPHAKFLIASTTIFSHPYKVAVDLIKSLWSHNVVDVAILLADSKNVTTFNVYTWKPYSLYSCGNNVSDTFVVDTCSYGVTQKNARWFENKVPRKLYKCPVIVRYLPWPPYVKPLKRIIQISQYDKDLGLEVNLLNMIANFLNLTMVYEKSTFDAWGNVDEHYSTDRDLTLLKENKIDLVAGGYSKTAERFLFFDYIQTNIQESLVWCVPHSPITTSSKNLMSVLTPTVCILITLLYIIISIGMWSVSKQNEYHFYGNLFNCCLNNFSVLIGIAVHLLPRTSKVRYLIFMFITFSFYLNVSYTTYLTSVLSSPSYKEKYGTVEEIYKHNLRTYFISNAKVFFEMSGNNMKQNTDVSFSEKWLNCSYVPDCFNLIISKKDSALCVTRLHKDYMLKTHFKGNGSSVYCFEDNILTYTVTIYMRKGFPLLHLFDRTMAKMVEGGFVRKWVKDERESKQRKVESVDTQSFGFDNLLPVFYMVMLGYIIATVVFIGEIAVFHLFKFYYMIFR